MTADEMEGNLTLNWATTALSMATGVLSYAALNFWGKPVLDFREKRRDALHAAERYAYVGLHGLPSDEYVKAALGALHNAGNALRTIARERALSVRIYCWIFGYDPDFAARAVLGLGEAARGEFAFTERTRRLTLHAALVSLGAAHHLSAAEVATAREEMARWHDCQRELTVGSGDSSL